LIEEVLEVAEKFRNVDDRLAVLVSGKPQIESPKLLGIPVISDSTGVAHHRAVVDL
jgi:hypothetical protein